jgi:hypothetical protein
MVARTQTEQLRDQAPAPLSIPLGKPFAGKERRTGRERIFTLARACVVTAGRWPGPARWRARRAPQSPPARAGTPAGAARSRAAPPAKPRAISRCGASRRPTCRPTAHLHGRAAERFRQNLRFASPGGWVLVKAGSIALYLGRSGDAARPPQGPALAGTRKRSGGVSGFALVAPRSRTSANRLTACSLTRTLPTSLATPPARCSMRATSPPAPIQATPRWHVQESCPRRLRGAPWHR